MQLITFLLQIAVKKCCKLYYVAGSVLHIVEPEFTLRNACDNAATLSFT